MGADSLRFASVGIMCRCIGAVEQTLDRVNVLRLSFKFKLNIGRLKLGQTVAGEAFIDSLFCGRQSQVWL